MTVRHNYLDVEGTKPTSLETAEHEIVINEVDGSLWTKNSAGQVVQVGGSSGGGGGSRPVVQVVGNFNAEPEITYIVSTADITLPGLIVGETFEFHAVTDNVRVLNPSYTISNGNRSITAGDNLLMRNGQTVTMSAISLTELEVR